MKPHAPAFALLLALVSPTSARADGLSMKAIDEVVEKNDRAIQVCARVVERRGDVVAVNVLLTIDPDGHVTDAFAASPSRAAQCVEKIARKLHFPAPGESTQISFPFLLLPRR